LLFDPNTYIHALNGNGEHPLVICRRKLANPALTEEERAVREVIEALLLAAGAS
jgi:hypothetical protein